MKTIKDAVIELEGKLPNPSYRKTSNASGWYISSTGKLTHAVDCVWFEPEEFEACAKRIGYINGYRWGVEYPTNGKRPELPDDVVVDVKVNDGRFNGSYTGKERQVSNCLWVEEVVAFRITDPRYKPVDEVSEISESKPDAESVSEKPESNWYELGQFPPISAECEVYNHTFGKNAAWENCKILWRGEFLIVYSSDSHHECSASNEHLEFRPVKAKTEREKVIEAAAKEFHKNCMVDYSGQPFLDGIASLYDAGMLVLPPKKSDTED